VETGCEGGQGSPRAIAPRKKKRYLFIYVYITIVNRRACSTNGGEYECIKILVAKPEGRRPLRRPRHKWVDNTKMDLTEI
jgi:hypothetical protein